MSNAGYEQLIHRTRSSDAEILAQSQLMMAAFVGRLGLVFGCSKNTYLLLCPPSLWLERGDVVSNSSIMT
ncbi:hypothetical protein PAXRUDRAFT_834954 [Paxillus rubicundulus Ve08.2h10]|uniref:Uncharacterized protein n=1 Tax=Paxillus rubicundulus Ve08.2h10 TaxID=930991 RepID=A0A0D0D1X4_9AGAM|nr:hypothetical protein PAXRUDRAFT_834954 [Paxillus rubicundulus Ve08.2h10]